MGGSISSVGRGGVGVKKTHDDNDETNETDDSLIFGQKRDGFGGGVASAGNDDFYKYSPDLDKIKEIPDKEATLLIKTTKKNKNKVHSSICLHEPLTAKQLNIVLKSIASMKTNNVACLYSFFFQVTSDVTAENKKQFENSLSFIQYELKNFDNGLYGVFELNVFRDFEANLLTLNRTIYTLDEKFNKNYLTIFIGTSPSTTTMCHFSISTTDNKLSAEFIDGWKSPEIESIKLNSSDEDGLPNITIINYLALPLTLAKGIFLKELENCTQTLVVYPTVKTSPIGYSHLLRFIQIPYIMTFNRFVLILLCPGLNKREMVYLQMANQALNFEAQHFQFNKIEPKTSVYSNVPFTVNNNQNLIKLTKLFHFVFEYPAEPKETSPTGVAKLEKDGQLTIQDPSTCLYETSFSIPGLASGISLAGFRVYPLSIPDSAALYDSPTFNFIKEGSYDFCFLYLSGNTVPVVNDFIQLVRNFLLFLANFDKPLILGIELPNDSLHWKLKKFIYALGHKYENNRGSYTICKGNSSQRAFIFFHCNSVLKTEENAGTDGKVSYKLLKNDQNTTRDTVMYIDCYKATQVSDVDGFYPTNGEEIYMTSLLSKTLNCRDERIAGYIPKGFYRIRDDINSFIRNSTRVEATWTTIFLYRGGNVDYVMQVANCMKGYAAVPFSEAKPFFLIWIPTNIHTYVECTEVLKNKNFESRLLCVKKNITIYWHKRPPSESPLSWSVRETIDGCVITSPPEIAGIMLRDMVLNEFGTEIAPILDLHTYTFIFESEPNKNTNVIEERANLQSVNDELFIVPQTSEKETLITSVPNKRGLFCIRVCLKSQVPLHIGNLITYNDLESKLTATYKTSAGILFSCISNADMATLKKSIDFFVDALAGENLRPLVLAIIYNRTAANEPEEYLMKKTSLSDFFVQQLDTHTNIMIIYPKSMPTKPNIQIQLNQNCSLVLTGKKNERKHTIFITCQDKYIKRDGSVTSFCYKLNTTEKIYLETDLDVNLTPMKIYPTSTPVLYFADIDETKTATINFPKLSWITPKELKNEFRKNHISLLSVKINFCELPLICKCVKENKNVLVNLLIQDKTEVNKYINLNRYIENIMAVFKIYKFNLASSDLYWLTNLDNSITLNDAIVVDFTSMGHWKCKFYKNAAKKIEYTTDSNLNLYYDPEKGDYTFTSRLPAFTEAEKDATVYTLKNSNTEIFTITATTALAILSKSDDFIQRIYLDVYPDIRLDCLIAPRVWVLDTLTVNDFILFTSLLNNAYVAIVVVVKRVIAYNLLNDFLKHSYNTTQYAWLDNGSVVFTSSSLLGSIRKVEGAKNYVTVSIDDARSYKFNIVFVKSVTKTKYNELTLEIPTDESADADVVEEIASIFKINYSLVDRHYRIYMPPDCDYTNIIKVERNHTIKSHGTYAYLEKQFQNLKELDEIYLNPKINMLPNPDISASTKMSVAFAEYVGVYRGALMEQNTVLLSGNVFRPDSNCPQYLCIFHPDLNEFRVDSSKDHVNVLNTVLWRQGTTHEQRRTALEYRTLRDFCKRICTIVKFGANIQQDVKHYSPPSGEHIILENAKSVKKICIRSSDTSPTLPGDGKSYAHVEINMRSKRLQFPTNMSISKMETIFQINSNIKYNITFLHL
ncbi:hypothetical protein CCFV1_ORF017 [Cotesia congregata filamentous virus 1]|uniref:Uncharacterized protein n=1 Tax=Cotesia congregata filamentous virus 1 TaxID=3064291 RepID=A0ABC8QN53_9VIRU|nr:hypothetical protein CCFV1_ORF017 [Cotesia congregata filamentous virus 1]